MSMTDTQRVTNGDKPGIKREIELIPLWSYIVAACLFVGFPVLFLTFVWPNGAGSPGGVFRFVIPFIPATFLGFLVLMIGYVNRDAGRRGMSRTLLTLLVIFVPNAIGFIIYFLMRNPIQINCPKCGTATDPRANYCSHCRYGFHPTCSQCKAAVRSGDTFCANCGVQLEHSSG